MKTPANWRQQHKTMLRNFSLGILLALGYSVAVPLFAASRSQDSSTVAEKFFLVSSVDAKKRQIVLKAPTEVTELVSVTDKTTYRDDRGKVIEFSDLRAGDTIYVTFASGQGELPTVLRIRKGPMTLQELHRRYLNYQFTHESR
jgi:hypothetical protein